ncbi:hypothetical protein BWQ96_03826 [Gracilariopsis chorda]|uniref:Uncharacterized protein n=1 Tax=Gracilariopsis chorda TaxID=448386 RepID=A0A2V3IWC2_9FLOR|nr:hypothetical protein BWQ96_03826 [Gracilariopsis chorda]|eukprot:PXF46432.1 hypothetical protein BWQ96_03826 [Gracilariopsis chorda]
MVSGKAIRKTQVSRARFDPTAVAEALKFLFNPSHVGTLSWGYKVLRISANETIPLPALSHREIRKDIYLEYVTFCDQESATHISRGSFVFS